MYSYLNLPERFTIPEFKFKQDSPNYEKEVRTFLQRIKNIFPQFSFFADEIQKSFYQTLDNSNKKTAIQANPIIYKSTDFQVIPTDEIETKKVIDRMEEFVKTPEILDILLRINYIYDTFPALTPNLDNLLLSISMQNDYPLIKLVIISQLFSMPSRRVQDKIYEFETIDMNYPGEIVSCIFNQKDQEILPLTLTNPFFPVSKDSIYLRYYKHDYVFNPSTKTVSFCKTGPKNKISTKQFSDFLTNPDEKVEEIGIFNDQLFFVQLNSIEKLRITFYKKGILVQEIIKKDYIIEINDEYEKCKYFQNNLMIFMKNGKKCLYNIGKHILIKEPNLSQFYYDLSHVSIYDKINEVFILPNYDNDKLIYHIIKKEKKKSNFVQILPPFYGVQTDEIISRISFELMNLCTEIISDLIESKPLITTNLVSDPILHIQYALDLAETIQKNDFNHDQNLCDYCLIALTRFIIINIYQLNSNQQKIRLADFQIKRITRLFCSFKMSGPHFDTLFALLSIVNHGIYTKSFINNVLHPFVPLLDDKRILKTSSFVLFIKPENIVSMNIKEKMTFLQEKVKDFVEIFNETNLDKELIPFISTYFEILQEALISKSVSNISIFSYFSSLIPFLCTMENTPELSSVILTYLIKNLDKLFIRVNSVIDKIAKLFDDNNFSHFKETKTIEIKIPSFWMSNVTSFMPFFNDSNLDDYYYKTQKQIPNEKYAIFNDLKKEDLLFYLLPNAIINCIRICYNSIEITQAEKDNQCYLFYQLKQMNSKEAAISKISSSSLFKIPKRATSEVVPSHQEENEFLLSLDEDSLLIKRLRKEIKNMFQRNIPKEIEEIEILIFKTLLFQSKLIKYALNVNENSQINQFVKIAWKTAIKVRTDLRLAKQFEANKKEVHINLKERYNDYIKSIKEKCSFLLGQNNIEDTIDPKDSIKQNYSFITSNIQLNKLLPLQEINKKREEIKKNSLLSIKKIIKIKMPNAFLRSIISYIIKDTKLSKALINDDEFYSFLINSNDSFIHLCAFDFVNNDKFYETALRLQDREENPDVLQFLEAITEESDENNDDVDIDHLLELIGKNQYSYQSANIKACIKKVSESIKFETLVSKLNDFNDVSLGSFVIINNSFQSMNEKELNLLCPVLINLQSKIPEDINDYKNKIILNLYVSVLNLIIKNDYNLFKTNILPKINLSKYEDSVNLQNKNDVNISDLIELLHEIEEKQQNSIEIDDNNNYFVQLKGDLSSMSDLNPNTITCYSNETLYFYIFSKPIDKNEKIGFHFKFPDDKQVLEYNSYILIGTLNMDDEFNGVIPASFTITNNYFSYSVNDNLEKSYDIILMKSQNNDTLSFYIEDKINKKYIEMTSSNLPNSPQIPFFYVFESNITITYDYCSNFKPDESYTFETLSTNVTSAYDENLDQLMTIFPSNIVGNKIHIKNNGDGIIIKTNDKNDNAEIALFNEDGVASLSTVDLASKECNIVKEKHFLVLLRSLVISGYFNDKKFIENYISEMTSFQLSESLFEYLVFNLSYVCLNFIFNDEISLNRIIKKYKSSMSCLICNNIDKVLEIITPNDFDIIVLILNELIDDPLHFIVLISNQFADDIEDICYNLKYRHIKYNENDFDNIKSKLEILCEDTNLNTCLKSNVFLLMFKDLLNFVLEHSNETVSLNLNNINNDKLIRILFRCCDKPIGIPLIIGILFKNFNSTKTLKIAPHKKFVLSLKCQNIENNEILEENTEYQFDHQIEIKAVKPEITDVFSTIKKYNETYHLDTFLKLYENRSDLLTYSIESLNDENLNSNILYLYLVLFEKLDEDENGDEIFLLKKLDQKLRWLRIDLPIYSNDELMRFSFHRYPKSHQKELIFDQFCKKIGQDLVKLRDTGPFRVNFVGEGGIDEGGLRREAITLIYDELIDTKNGFFEIQEDGFLVPSKSCDEKQLKTIGAFIACCFYSGNPRDFHLSPKIWPFLISSEFSDPEIDNDSVLALKNGFNIVVPEFNLRYFNDEDVRKLTCGDSLSFDRFIKCCNFYNSSIEKVFTDAVSKYDQNELKKLLKFITGSHTLPFDSNFSISISYKSPDHDNVDESKWPLPVAHTCFHSIDICPFTNAGILAEKLKLAVLTEIISDDGLNFELLSFD